MAELTADGPASVVLAAGKVAISDPTQTRSSVTVDLTKPGLRLVSGDEGVQVTRQGTGWRLVVDTMNRNGATATATFH